MELPFLTLFLGVSFEPFVLNSPCLNFLFLNFLFFELSLF
ncbi:hypothetical protein HPHPP25C_1432 [Helicobacter pylori Hp P-25c]|nr:hypothetical protein HPHPP25C_1432 [Helicobacter pylori Hp P-25c]